MKLPPWVDGATAALIRDLVEALVHAHREQIQAIILFGSIARHDERSLDDPHSSDVDLLIIFTTDDRQVLYEWDTGKTIGPVYSRHLDAPREVNFMFATHTMHEWDPAFVANVLHDGIPLYGSLPMPDSLHLYELAHESGEQPLGPYG